MRTTVSLVCIAIGCAGCSTVSAPMANFAALTAAERSNETSSTTTAAIQADFAKAMELCDSYMLASREAYYGSGKTELSIATVGILAGSVVVPALAAKAAAAKSAVAGWGGVSGAANAAQYTLQQKGVSAAKLGASYQETRREITAATKAYAVATRNSERLKALYDLYVACRYPAIPQAEAPAPLAPTDGASAPAH